MIGLVNHTSEIPPQAGGFRKYIWAFSMGDDVHGGMKARLDSEVILRGSRQWQTFDTSLTGSAPARLCKMAGAFGWMLRQPRSGVFFVQYPIHGGRGQRLIAALMFRRFRVVVLLHDFDELRKTATLASNSLLRKAAFLVSSGLLHQRMRDELKGIPVRELEIWDYLVAPGFKPGEWNAAGPILFAGSLWPGKIGWLYRADAKRPALLVRGRGYEQALAPGLGDTLAGPFDSENPVFMPPAGWGLVWDGAKLDSEGTEADYERINQPHKVSLYLACGLPLIVWSEGYAAGWLVRNGCGVTTPSLEAIPEILAKITPAQHAAMRQRAQECGEKVRAGYYLLNALAGLGL